MFKPRLQAPDEKVRVIFYSDSMTYTYMLRMGAPYHSAVVDLLDDAVAMMRRDHPDVDYNRVEIRGTYA